MAWLSGLGAAVYALFFHVGSLLSIAAYAALAATLANVFYVNAYTVWCHYRQQSYEHPNQYAPPGRAAAERTTGPDDSLAITPLARWRGK